MTAREVIEKGLELDGTESASFQFRLKPGLSHAQIQDLEERLNATLPSEVRELLAFTSGFYSRPIGNVNFSAKEMFEFPDILPLGLPLAADECGNNWVVDIKRSTGEWGAVFFLSHDPPVVVIQAPDLVRFISQIFDYGDSEPNGRLNYVREMAASKIWREDPYLLDIGASRVSADPNLAEFSRQLSDAFRIADLRSLEVGSGFAWGRNGPNSKIRRYGSELLFGVETKKSLLGTLLKRKS